MDIIPNDNLFDLFMGNLKEIIQYGVCLLEHKSLHKAFSTAKRVASKTMATGMVSTHIYIECNVSTPNITPPTRPTP